MKKFAFLLLLPLLAACEGNGGADTALPPDEDLSSSDVAEDRRELATSDIPDGALAAEAIADHPELADRAGALGGRR